MAIDPPNWFPVGVSVCVVIRIVVVDLLALILAKCWTVPYNSCIGITADIPKGVEMKYQVVEKVDGISDEFTVVAKFDTESAAQEFATVHYETRIGILSECACLNCVDGFIVDVDWWKSFQVSVLPDIDGGVK